MVNDSCLVRRSGRHTDLIAALVTVSRTVLMRQLAIESDLLRNVLPVVVQVLETTYEVDNPFASRHQKPML